MAYNPEDFYIGQIVRIREWEDMEEEFGLSVNGHCILCKFKFLSSMKMVCGREFEIEKIKNDEIFFKDMCPELACCLFSADMIEPIDCGERCFDKSLFYRALNINNGGVSCAED